ncbi:MAG: NAD(P)/FAD-dependent oxidoreductase [Gemmatimonadetes bacterium]|nr:NAD(P)/FAD-dependent oxidoreductase [Gemmatimonadota bacterium]MYA42768.1 NAD(P)/FAD-dependent oxidoreductase [Gemmatimonadota bacterium]
MARKYDVIVIGGGHNGLVHAAYLARAGLDVCVLERRPLVGGATVTEEIFPGFRYSVFSYVVSLMRPDIIRELDLPRHGLAILPLESTLTPLPDGDRLYRDADHHRTWREIARFSIRDAEAYDEYGRSLFYMARAVKHLLGIAPPDPARLGPRDIRGLLGLGRHFLDLEPDQLHLLVKLMTMSAADFVDEWFETDVLKATLSASGIIGTFLGPRSPGTAYVLLHHYMGEIDGHFRAWGFAKGGTGAVANAIASAAREAGAEIRTDAPVARALVKNGRVNGVALANGDELHASVVSSSLDPHRTFLDLIDESQLTDDLLSAVRAYRFRGSSGKVNLALDAAPDFTCMPGHGPHLRGAVSISPSIDYLERAYDDAKYGDFSRDPYIDIVIPSAIDPAMAPPGKHVMSCFVQYAPYELREGTWDEKREAFGDTVVDTLARYIPNLKDIILHRQVVTPLDIERTTGLTQGNIFQGELTPSQLFFLRPAAGYAGYRTPVRGYYQCGSGTHPGGGIMGAPGKLAAGRVLADLQRGLGRRRGRISTSGPGRRGR